MLRISWEVVNDLVGFLGIWGKVRILRNLWYSAIVSCPELVSCLLESVTRSLHINRMFVHNSNFVIREVGFD